MKVVKKIILGLLLLGIVGVVTLVIVANILTAPVNPKDKEVIRFEVVENDTFYSLGKKLLDMDLIKSEFAYKVYVKLNKPDNLQMGIYSLSRKMTLEEIIDILNGGSTYNPYIVNITIKEGYNMRKIAKTIEEVTENSYDDVLEKLTDNAYISKLIEEYWFLTDDILDSKIYYPLEGYLFPETYQISSKNSVEEIFKVLLDQTNIVLTKYKTEIENSKYSIHEIMTLSSIVEQEAGNANDRASVAGVFYNRLNAKWSLGSDVTTYYGSKIDDFSYSLTNKELKDCTNAYNTRCATKVGLPVGPICNPGEESIKAAISPTSHDYYYFVADCSGNTYLNKNKSGHSQIIQKLKNDGNWCA